MLTMKSVSRRYGAKLAVDDVSLAIRPGSFVGIVGRSGAGKSTLLRMINRLVEPTAGAIAFDGTDVTALRSGALRDWRARCAMIFQQFNLVGQLDVLNNVLIGRLNAMPTARALLRLWRPADVAVALSSLDQFDIAPLASQRADSLSGGQQQRVAIARALVQRPSLILADEPIASLDPRNTAVVMDALQRVNRHYGITVLCNLHSVDIARSYCDRLVGMAQGRIAFDGPASAFTPAAARDLYGIEADAVQDRAARSPVPEAAVLAALA